MGGESVHGKPDAIFDRLLFFLSFVWRSINSFSLRLLRDCAKSRTKNMQKKTVGWEFRRGGAENKPCKQGRGQNCTGDLSTHVEKNDEHQGCGGFWISIFALSASSPPLPACPKAMSCHIMHLWNPFHAALSRPHRRDQIDLYGMKNDIRIKHLSESRRSSMIHRHGFAPPPPEPKISFEIDKTDIFPSTVDPSISVEHTSYSADHAAEHRATGLHSIGSFAKRQLKDLVSGSPYHNMAIAMN